MNTEPVRMLATYSEIHISIESDFRCFPITMGALKLSPRRPPPCVARHVHANVRTEGGPPLPSPSAPHFVVLFSYYFVQKRTRLHPPRFWTTSSAYTLRISRLKYSEYLLAVCTRVNLRPGDRCPLQYAGYITIHQSRERVYTKWQCQYSQKKKNERLSIVPLYLILW